MVEKMIRKNVPVNIREKVVRRVLKNLLTKSSVVGRRSILSEMYPTESIFSTSTRFHAEEPMIKNLIEKLLRRSEVPEVVLAKIIRKLIKSVNKVSPIEKLFSSRRYSKEEPLTYLIEKLFSTRRHFNVESLLEKMSRRSILSEMYPTESIFGEHSYESKHFNVLSKVLSKVIKSVVKTHEHKYLTKSVLKSIVKSVLRNAEVTPFVTRKNVEELCYTCEAVCENVYSYSTKNVCRVCEKVCPMTSTFASQYEQPIFGRWNKLSKLF